MKPPRKINLDRIGAYASTLCAVHCLITGVALGLLSVVGLGFLGSPTAEACFFVVTVTVGIAAVVHGARKHHSVIPALIFLCGMGSLLVSHFVFGHGQEGSQGPWQSTFLNVVGGCSLVLFHYLNQRLQHSCDCTHCNH